MGGNPGFKAFREQAEDLSAQSWRKRAPGTGKSVSTTMLLFLVLLLLLLRRVPASLETAGQINRPGTGAGGRERAGSSDFGGTASLYLVAMGRADEGIGVR